MNKILLVDDEPQLIDMLQARLEACGYNVVTAYDGEEALEKARKEKPNLIILDLMLPKIDGYKVCAVLKKDGECRTIPIIMLTALAQERDRKLGLEAGADGYVTKPFEHQVLLAEIKKFLG